MSIDRIKNVIIREELFALTNDTFETIILGQLIYWQERVKDFDKFIIEERERKKQEGIVLNIDLQNGWIYKSAKQLIDECMLTISEVTMRRYLQSLIDKHYIECRKNPINKWDKKLQYRVNLNYIISEIHKIGYNGLSGYKISNLQNEESIIQNEGAIAKINNIEIINNKEDKDKSLSKKEEIDDLFEQCWKAYRRKGSKKNAKQRWDKLNNEDKQKIVAHIPAYISSVSEIKYQRDFERYIKDKLYNNVVYRGNSVLFDPEQLNEIGEYRPKTDGFNLHWIESEKCYMTPFDFDMLNDGYTKDNRPSSAIIMHNGLKYQWDTTIKAWIKL